MPRAGFRAIRLLLVLVLSCGVSIQSTRAMLPEIVVGGTVLFQVAQVISELLPQIATLGTSLMTLASASQEAGGTLSRLFEQIFPKRKTSASKKDIGPIDVPVITGPTDAAAPAPAEDPPAGEVSGDLEGKLSQLVTAYRQGQEPAALSHRASSPRASLTREVSYATLADQTTESLIETVRGGDERTFDKFLAAVKRLDPGDRPAIAPVLQKAVTKGSRFSRVHGDEKGAVPHGFAKLKALHDVVK